MEQVKLRLHDDRRTITVTLAESFELALDTKGVEAMIRALGRKRCLMEPQEPHLYKFVDPTSVDNPRWGITTRHDGLSGQGAFLMLRDPRYGWLNYTFHRPQLQEFIAGLTVIEKGLPTALGGIKEAYH